jgi:hypothetical protein
LVRSWPWRSSQVYAGVDDHRVMDHHLAGGTGHQMGHQIGMQRLVLAGVVCSTRVGTKEGRLCADPPVKRSDVITLTYGDGIASEREIVSDRVRVLRIERANPERAKPYAERLSRSWKQTFTPSDTSCSENLDNSDAGPPPLEGRTMSSISFRP